MEIGKLQNELKSYISESITPARMLVHSDPATDLSNSAGRHFEIIDSKKRNNKPSLGQTGGQKKQIYSTIGDETARELAKTKGDYYRLYSELHGGGLRNEDTIMGVMSSRTQLSPDRSIERRKAEERSIEVSPDFP